MDADRWIVLLALCFICVSSNETDFENSCDSDVYETLSAPLGSSVLLPCIFETSGLGRVSWAHTAGLDLVHLTSEGRIKFLDHRYGRVKVFPNRGSEGDYSIRIDELQNSDLGRYCCKQGHDCLQVELVAVGGALSREGMLWIYICVGVAVFTLLSIGGYCFMKCILCCYNTPIYNTSNPEGAGTEAADARAAPEEAGRVPVEQEQSGGGDGPLVYENDDQDPSGRQSDLSRNYRNPIEDQPDPERTQPTASTIYPNLNQFERVDTQRTKQGFHRELFSRLRQARLSQHYYVNQGETSRQQASSTPPENPHGAARFGKKKKKAKKNGILQNPIYNRSTDQLNHL
ncbi:uncharacterized protein LOC117741538 isoform X2 [Cyclopterus lumpus]|uniref:uncharacterized protein LOC117741538 isoform X2 n=1 Tax=Cyclopterus lumpus TaxID=8103 RepID=UPI0014864A5A|nr:uncharacterized protein LOC117741538 isoform X2 [Cyclopterus lumpus]